MTFSIWLMKLMTSRVVWQRTMSMYNYLLMAIKLTIDNLNEELKLILLFNVMDYSFLLMLSLPITLELRA